MNTHYWQINVFKTLKHLATLKALCTIVGIINVVVCISQWEPSMHVKKEERSLHIGPKNARNVAL